MRNLLSPKFLVILCMQYNDCIVDKNKAAYSISIENTAIDFITLQHHVYTSGKDINESIKQTKR
uniref:Uncharacterized protein n=1 Tax=Strigamia maritima TaxID=126957 RepID=T1JHX0_STRMM